ncbi:hypothetical protein AB0G04_34515 [Actinoplanes sp. NPDC023801]|uniref:hypothetical protein n=1 Tax=Actinoplanes sp. NPDC023801 TaxID=3154595 RepID=UPI0033C9DAB9
MQVRTILSLAAAALAMAGSVAVLNTPLNSAAAEGGHTTGNVVLVVEDGTIVPVSDLMRAGWDCPDNSAAS